MRDFPSPVRSWGKDGEKEILFAVGGISGSACGNPTCKQDCGPTALC